MRSKVGGARWGVKIESFDDLTDNTRYKENFFAIKNLKRMNITMEYTS